jgi:hypothetical protein
MNQRSDLPSINSHDSWSPLQEVWLGDVYPAAWYDHLEPAVRDVFRQLTEITQQDLTKIQHCIESFGVTVRRPVYDSIDHYVQAGHLVKPQICPRDNFVVIGNTIYCHQQAQRPWQTWIDLYLKDPRCRATVNNISFLHGANVVRVGRDIIWDLDVFKHDDPGLWPEYRVHTVRNGGHMDGCFAVLRPGLILANHYWHDYQRTFPGWHIIQLDDPTYAAAPSTGYRQPYPVYNGKFWDTTVAINRAFNQHIIDHALDWVGCYTETFFELNCLVIDPDNVIMLAENEPLAETLSQYGIQVHWVPFRTRSFWDGAMHCLTVDIRRDSEIVDYFPQRDGR